MNKLYLFKISLILTFCFLFRFNFLYADSNFQNWLILTKNDAIKAGISEKTYSNIMKDLKKINPKVLSYYNNQPEFKITFNNYIKRNISPKRISIGRKKINANLDILNKISSIYFIPPEIIVSIWGIETNYGSYTGGFKVLESLATLAYLSKRKVFFKKEFLNAIKIIDDGLISKKFLTGSWAGAMGQSQFMPSSYLNYAVDFSKDEKIDIWNTKSDIFASMSNYLKKHGWAPNQPWSFEIDKKEFDLIRKLKIKEIDYKTIVSNQLADKEYLKRFKKPFKGTIKIVGKKTEERYFIIFKNFYVLKKYNNSDFYALTVGSLANKIINR